MSLFLFREPTVSLAVEGHKSNLQFYDFVEFSVDLHLTVFNVGCHRQQGDSDKNVYNQYGGRDLMRET